MLFPWVVVILINTIAANAMFTISGSNIELVDTEKTHSSYYDNDHPLCCHKGFCHIDHANDVDGKIYTYTPAVSLEGLYTKVSLDGPHDYEECLKKQFLHYRHVLKWDNYDSDKNKDYLKFDLFVNIIPESESTTTLFKHESYESFCHENAIYFKTSKGFKFVKFKQFHDMHCTAKITTRTIDSECTDDTKPTEIYFAIGKVDDFTPYLITTNYF